MDSQRGVSEVDGFSQLCKSTFHGGDVVSFRVRLPHGQSTPQWTCLGDYSSPIRHEVREGGSGSNVYSNR